MESHIVADHVKYCHFCLRKPRLFMAVAAGSQVAAPRVNTLHSSSPRRPGAASPSLTGVTVLLSGSTVSSGLWGPNASSP